jgi:hypothetical protein
VKSKRFGQHSLFVCDISKGVGPVTSTHHCNIAFELDVWLRVSVFVSAFQVHMNESLILEHILASLFSLTL